MKEQLPKIIFIILLNSSLICCSSIIPKEIRNQALKGVSLKELASNPAAYYGKTVILGGKVVVCRNLDGHGEIEVLQKPLGFRDRPRDRDYSEGKFIGI